MFPPNKEAAEEDERQTSTVHMLGSTGGTQDQRRSLTSRMSPFVRSNLPEALLRSIGQSLREDPMKLSTVIWAVLYLVFSILLFVSALLASATALLVRVAQPEPIYSRVSEPEDGSDAQQSSSVTTRSSPMTIMNLRDCRGLCRSRTNDSDNTYIVCPDCYSELDKPCPADYSTMSSFVVGTVEITPRAIEQNPAVEPKNELTLEKKVIAPNSPEIAASKKTRFVLNEDRKQGTLLVSTLGGLRSLGKPVIPRTTKEERESIKNPAPQVPIQFLNPVVVEERRNRGVFSVETAGNSYQKVEHLNEWGEWQQHATNIVMVDQTRGKKINSKESSVDNLILGPESPEILLSTGANGTGESSGFGFETRNKGLGTLAEEFCQIADKYVEACMGESIVLQLQSESQLAGDSKRTEIMPKESVINADLEKPSQKEDQSPSQEDASQKLDRGLTQQSTEIRTKVAAIEAIVTEHAPSEAQPYVEIFGVDRNEKSQEGLIEASDCEQMKLMNVAAIEAIATKYQSDEFQRETQPHVEASDNNRNEKREEVSIKDTNCEQIKMNTAAIKVVATEYWSDEFQRETQQHVEASDINRIDKCEEGLIAEDTYCEQMKTNVTAIEDVVMEYQNDGFQRETQQHVETSAMKRNDKCEEGLIEDRDLEQMKTSTAAIKAVAMEYQMDEFQRVETQLLVEVSDVNRNGKREEGLIEGLDHKQMNGSHYESHEHLWETIMDGLPQSQLEEVKTNQVLAEEMKSNDLRDRKLLSDKETPVETHDLDHQSTDDRIAEKKLGLSVEDLRLEQQSHHESGIQIDQSRNLSKREGEGETMKKIESGIQTGQSNHSSEMEGEEAMKEIESGMKTGQSSHSLEREGEGKPLKEVESGIQTDQLSHSSEREREGEAMKEIEIGMQTGQMSHSSKREGEGEAMKENIVESGKQIEKLSHSLKMESEEEATNEIESGMQTGQMSHSSKREREGGNMKEIVESGKQIEKSSHSLKTGSEGEATNEIESRMQTGQMSHSSIKEGEGEAMKEIVESGKQIEKLSHTLKVEGEGEATNEIESGMEMEKLSHSLKTEGKGEAMKEIESGMQTGQMSHSSKREGEGEAMKEIVESGKQIEKSSHSLKTESKEEATKEIESGMEMEKLSHSLKVEGEGETMKEIESGVKIDQSSCSSNSGIEGEAMAMKEIESGWKTAHLSHYSKRRGEDEVILMEIESRLQKVQSSHSSKTEIEGEAMKEMESGMQTEKLSHSLKTEAEGEAMMKEMESEVPTGQSSHSSKRGGEEEAMKEIESGIQTAHLSPHSSKREGEEEAMKEKDSGVQTGRSSHSSKREIEEEAMKEIKSGIQMEKLSHSLKTEREEETRKEIESGMQTEKLSHSLKTEGKGEAMKEIESGTQTAQLNHSSEREGEEEAILKEIKSGVQTVQSSHSSKTEIKGEAAKEIESGMQKEKLSHSSKMEDEGYEAMKEIESGMQTEKSNDSFKKEGEGEATIKEIGSEAKKDQSSHSSKREGEGERDYKDDNFNTAVADNLHSSSNLPDSSDILIKLQNHEHRSVVPPPLHVSEEASQEIKCSEDLEEKNEQKEGSNKESSI